MSDSQDGWKETEPVAGSAAHYFQVNVCKNSSPTSIPDEKSKVWNRCRNLEKANKPLHKIAIHFQNKYYEKSLRKCYLKPNEYCDFLKPFKYFYVDLYFACHKY